MIYLGWCLLLFVQQASHTWVSRARNGSSYWQHALAAVFSNGVWYASQFIFIGIVMKDLAWWHAAGLGVVYVLACVAGSVFMHWLVAEYFERNACKK